MFKAVSFLLLVQVPQQYQAAHDRALAQGTALVVGVGCAAPAGDWVHVNVRALEGFKSGTVVISVPEADYMRWVADLPAWTRADDVRKALLKSYALPKKSVPVPAGKKWNPYRSNRDPRSGREVSGVRQVSAVRGVDC